MENMDKGLTDHSTKMGADKLPKIPQNLSAQAQKFGDLDEKKASLGVRSPWWYNVLPIES